jgi:hypothetical protein
MAAEYRPIRTAEDVTAAHIETAADCREGLYGGEKLSWLEVIDRVEASDEDWGSDMTSPAIKHLQREVRRVLSERQC